MWIDQRIPALRRRPALGAAAAVLLVLAAVGLKLLLPGVPPFLTFFPAVVLSAFIGGRRPGIAALAMSIIASLFFIAPDGLGTLDHWDYVSVGGFLLVGGLIIFVVDLLDQSVTRLSRERHRLELSLRAANAASWELTPGAGVKWDANFFALLGLDPDTVAPSTEKFLSMIHPEDRHRLANARAAMDAGRQPLMRDEYRLIRPDGRMIWLENHRAMVPGENLFIGITQDISQRKETEERIRMLMRELAHRVKNQFAVILAMIRETNKQTRTAEEFEALIHSRVMALSRSHDLLVYGGWKGTAVEDLMRTQIEPFGTWERCDVSGPPVILSPVAAQYLGMAFHELATNASKHGAFATADGRISVHWQLDKADQGEPEFLLSWCESGAAVPKHGLSRGFGTKVLEKIAPQALSGAATLTHGAEGLCWKLRAPWAGIVKADDPFK